MVLERMKECEGRGMEGKEGKQMEKNTNKGKRKMS